MDTFQKTFQNAAALNQEGVRCLSLNDGEGAYKHLKQALQIMTQLTAQSDAMGDDVVMDEAIEITEAVSIPFHDGSSYYVFSQALLFRPPSAPSSRSLAFCVSIIIFNMALTYHQRGHSKALALYEQSMALLQETFSADDYADDDEGNDGIHILQVLAQNNHSQILCATGQFQEANKGWGDLREMLPLIYYQTDRESSLVGDEVFSEIILNLLIPVTKIMAAAA